MLAVRVCVCLGCAEAGIGAQRIALARARRQVFVDVRKGDDLLDHLLLVVVLGWWYMLVWALTLVNVTLARLTVATSSSSRRVCSILRALIACCVG